MNIPIETISVSANGIHMESAKHAWTPSAIEKRLVSFSFLLGFLFIRWLFFSFVGFGVTLFTIGFILIGHYAVRDLSTYNQKGERIWFGLLFALSMSYSTFYNPVLSPFKNMILICLAAYALLTASGNRVENTVGSWIAYDLIGVIFKMPFSNLTLIFKGLISKGGIKNNRGTQITNILIGILASAFILILTLPLLLAVDSGYFHTVINDILKLNLWSNWDFDYNFVNLILSLPVTAYFYGLFIGLRNYGKWHCVLDENRLLTLDKMRVLPSLSTKIAFVFIIGLYSVFFISQAPYYIGAIKGYLPEGAASYASYARSGFFELVEIVLINLGLLILGFVFIKRQNLLRKDDLFFNLMSKLLSLITLFFIWTAFSKMYLYINVYGMTLRRLMPCIFMVFMAVVFILIILNPSPSKVVYRSIIFGSILLILTANLNLSGMVAAYNAERYIDGSLEDFDFYILRQAGASGISIAMDMSEQMENPVLQKEINLYLLSMNDHLKEYRTTFSDTIMDILARQKLLSVIDDGIL